MSFYVENTDYNYGSDLAGAMTDLSGTGSDEQTGKDVFDNTVGTNSPLFGKGVKWALTDDGAVGDTARALWNHGPWGFDHNFQMGRTLFPDEATQLYGMDGLKFDRPINEVTARYLNQVHRQDQAYGRAMSFDPQTLSSFLLKQGAGLVAGLTDPVQDLMMLLPPMRAAGLLSVGEKGALKAIFPGAEQFMGRSMLERAGMRFTQAATTGTIAGGLLGIPEWYLSTQEQKDYHFTDLLQSMVTGGLTYGIFHTLHGGLSDLFQPSSSFKATGTQEPKIYYGDSVLNPNDVANIISQGGDVNKALGLNEHVIAEEMRQGRPLSQDERLNVLEQNNGTRLPDELQKPVAQEQVRRVQAYQSESEAEHAIQRASISESTKDSPKVGKDIASAITPDEQVSAAEGAANLAKQEASVHAEHAPARRLQIIKDHVSQWKDVPLVLHATQAEMEKAVPGERAKTEEMGGNRKVKGFYDPATGKIHVVLENLKTPHDVAAVLRHEGAHVGFERLFSGSDRTLYNKIATDIYHDLIKNGDGELLKKIAGDYGFDPKKDVTSLIEEMMARKAQDEPNSSIVSTFLTQFKLLLSKVFPNAAKWGAKDMRGLIELSRQELLTGKTPEALSKSPAYSQEINPKDEPGQFSLPGFEGDVSALDDAVTNAKTRDEKFVALQKKREAYINYIVKQNIDEHMAKFVNPYEGIQAYLMGTNRQIAGARDSVASAMIGKNKLYISQLATKLETEGLTRIFDSPECARGIARELYRLDYSPEEQKTMPRGEDPKFENVAQMIKEVRDSAIAQANRSGAFIASLPGYIFRQSHDMWAVRKAGYQAWHDFISSKLDWSLIEKQQSIEGVPLNREAFLKGAYDGISTGVHLQEDAPVEITGKSMPSNEAKRMSVSRKLHFISSDAFMDYNDQFGMRSFSNAVMDGLMHLAKGTAVMEKLGTNPGVMFEQLLDQAKSTNRFEQPSFFQSVADRVQLKTESGLRQLYGTVMGLDSIPENVNLARIGQGVRSYERMIKQGMCLFSSLPDVPTSYLDLRYQGLPALKALNAVADGFLSNFDKNKTQVANSLGVLAHSLIEDLHTGIEDPNAGINNRLRGIETTFFKLNGMGAWDISIQRGMSRAMASWLGENAEKTFSEIEPATQRMLKMYNIDEPHWEVLRKVIGEAADGNKYLLPEHVMNVDQDSLKKLIETEGYGKSVDSYQNELMTRLMTYYTDRLGYGIPSPGAYERSILNWGTKPGTFRGELIRCAMQLKGFILTHTTRIIGREIYGRVGTMERMRGMATLVSATTALAYMGIQLRAIANGKTPLPPSWKSLENALVASGGAGIFGDYIFNNYDPNRNAWLDAVSGPTVSDAWTATSRPLSLMLNGRKLSAEDIKTARGFIPFNNLIGVKAAMDYGVMYRLQEMVNPGYLNRMEQKLREKTGQEFILPPSNSVR